MAIEIHLWSFILYPMTLPSEILLFALIDPPLNNTHHTHHANIQLVLIISPHQLIPQQPWILQNLVEHTFHTITMTGSIPSSDIKRWFLR